MEIVNPIQTPFADTVTEREIIEPSSENTGVVNWLHGFPADFSKSTGDGGKFVKRKTLNYILWYISAALKYFQKGGIALYNSAFSNGTYDKDSVLWFKRGDKYVLIQAVRNTNVEPNNEDLIKPESDTSKNWRMYKLLGYKGSTLTIDEPVAANKITIGSMNFSTGETGSAATGCPDPKSGTDFANKNYVDGIVKIVDALPAVPSPNTIYLLRSAS